MSYFITRNWEVLTFDRIIYLLIILTEGKRETLLFPNYLYIIPRGKESEPLCVC